MIIKKNFSILELEEEAKYLSEMAKFGMIFIGSTGEGHEFKQGEAKDIEYRVEYTIDPLDDSQMFELIDVYHSSKGGYYSYLKRVGDGEFISNDDRISVVSMQKNRIDRFTGLIIISLIIYFIYMFITHGNYLYLIVVALGIAMGIWVYNYRSKIINILNKLQ